MKCWRHLVLTPKLSETPWRLRLPPRNRSSLKVSTNVFKFIAMSYIAILDCLHLCELELIHPKNSTTPAPNSSYFIYYFILPSLWDTIGSSEKGKRRNGIPVKRNVWWSCETERSNEQQWIFSCGDRERTSAAFGKPTNLSSFIFRWILKTWH